MKSKLLTSAFAGLLLIALPACAKEDNNNGQHSSDDLQLRVDDSALDRSNQKHIVSYADMLDDVTPGVVSITTKRIVQEIRGGGNSDMYEEFFRRFGMPVPPQFRDERSPQQEQNDDNAPERMVPYGMGSGFIISADGYVLTNNHVITGGGRDEPADEIVVQLPDGRELEAELVGTDPQTDVAVLKIEDSKPFPHLTITDSEKTRVGDIVFAVGNPLSVGQTVTQGIISGKGRTNLGILGGDGYESFIQTDAAINRGNSGGPLLDAKGRVIGINTAIVSGTGGNIGIGFAVPSTLFRSVMTSLMDMGEVRRGFLGVGIQDVDRDLAEAMGLETTTGALINEVHEGLPADEAGIEAGDIITSVNGKNIADASGLRFRVSQVTPGETIELEIIRNGEQIDLDVVLGDRDELVAGIRNGFERRAEAKAILEGIEFSELDDAYRAQFDVPEGLAGVGVAEVAEDSPYARSRTNPTGLIPGMVLLQVNGQKVTTPQELDAALSRDSLNAVYIWFDGRRAFQTLRIAE